MLVASLAGASIGMGIWCILVGARRTPVPLEVAIAEMQRSRWSGQSDVASTDRKRSALASLARFGASRSTEVDLRMVDRSIQRHSLDKLTYALLGAGLPVLGAAVMAAGGVTVTPMAAILAAVVLAGMGAFLPESLLRTEASKARRRFADELTTYLDLVSVLIAGGRGVESALSSAAQFGDGGAFARLRSTIEAAQLNRQSPWAALDHLATEVSLPALAELSASVTLAGETGARVKESLRAKSHAIRIRLLADAEAVEQRRSEAMSAPVVMMLTAFVLLIGYPAVHTLMTF